MKYLILNREGENNFNANISSPFVISNQSNISYNDFDWLIEIDIPSNSEILGQPVIINNAKVFQNITVNNNYCNILLDEHNYKSFEYTFDTEGKYLLQFKCITPFNYSSTINKTIYQYITKIMFINNWTPFCLNAPNGTELYLNITRDFDTYEKWGPVSFKQFMPKVNKVVFHNETQRIASESLQSCAYLTSTNLSELNKLTSIGSAAFAGTNLSSIIIPKNCTTLEGNSFAFIKNKITELNLGNIQRINGCAFTNCTFDNLDIEIPESLTYVEQGIFYQSTGINSIKFKSSVPFETSYAGFSSIFGDAKTIYVPKGSRINYLNSGYCAAGFNGNAYDSAILNAQSSYDHYINAHPLLTYDPTFTYEDAIEYITVTNTNPGYQVSSIKNGYPAYQFWMNNYYGPVIYGLISSMNGVSVPSNDASDEDVSSYWNQIIDRFKNYQPSSYKNINDEVVGYWKDLVLNENNEIKDKYKETDRKFNVDLFNADAYEIGLSLVKPWIDHYYNLRADIETIELYNNKIRSEAQIEYDKVFNSLSKQYGFDKVIEY